MRRFRRTSERDGFILTKWTAGVLAVFLLAFPLVATPQPAPKARARTYEFNLERQPVTQALAEFFEVVNVSWGFVPGSPEIEQIPVGPLKGRYTLEAGLTELLKPAGFSFEWINHRSVSIIEPEIQPADTHATEGARNLEPPSSEDIVRYAPQKGPLERVLVRAGRLHDDEASASPGETLDRETLRERGVSTVAELLQQLSQQPYAHGEGFRASGAQFADLRGLGPDMTLVLINGRRVLPTASNISSNAFDLNALPITAVDRVEILFDSASAMYGSDAIGGVVNIVLRRDIQSPTLEVHYGAAEGGAEQHRATLSGGYRSRALQGTLVVDYFDVNGLIGETRGRWRDQDFRRFGGIDQRSINSAPGNITSPTAANLPGLPARFAAVPLDPSADFLSTAGERNLESLFRYWSLVPEARRLSIVAQGKLEITPRLTASAELLHVARTARFQFSPPMLPGLPVPASNAFNTFDAPVIANVLLVAIGPQAQHVESDLTRAVAALQANVGNWDAELAVVHTDEDASTWINRALDFNRVMIALAQPDPYQALNVFSSGTGGSAELLNSLLADRRIDPLSSRGTQATARAGGPLPLATRAGAFTATTGGEWRRETAQFDASIGSPSRSVQAAFAELHIPLVDARMGWSGVNALSVSLAGRIDDYSDFGPIFNPQYGLVWRWNREVMVRGTYGRSFRAPSLYELFLPKIATPAQFPDPSRNGEPAAFTVLAGGNQALEATRGESMTAGIIVKPASLAGLEISGTYWRVTVNDRVVLPSLPSVLANEHAFADRVTRAEPSDADRAAGLPGALRAVDVSRMNFGRLKTSGIDVSAQYTFESALGAFTPRVAATWVDEFETEDVPGMPARDRVGVADFSGTIVDWRAVGSLRWRRGAFGAAVSARHRPRYDDAVAGRPTGRTVGSQTIVDLQVSADFSERGAARAPWRGFTLAVGATNLFDEHAPFAEVNGLAGFDMSQGDLKGRFAYIRLGRSF